VDAPEQQGDQPGEVDQGEGQVHSGSIVLASLALVASIRPSAIRAAQA
jgi:hypothetical protein